MEFARRPVAESAGLNHRLRRRSGFSALMWAGLGTMVSTLPGFIKAINRYGRIRRRDGAYQWGIFRDLENPERYLETFLVDSWAEHLRQHERSTRADRAMTERVRSFTSGEPIVRHLLYVTANSAEQITEHRQQAQVERVAPKSL